MVGQEAHGWWAYAENSVETWEMTVKVDNRDTFAEVAITAFGVEGESPAGYFGIIKIVSDSGTETFLQGGTFGAAKLSPGRLSPERDQRARPNRLLGRVGAGAAVSQLLVI